MENEETLETSTVVGDTANLVEDTIDELLADGVVTTSVVVGSVLLAGDHHLRVEEVAVSTGADLVDDIGLQITVDGAGNMLSLTCRRCVRRGVVWERRLYPYQSLRRMC